MIVKSPFISFRRALASLSLIIAAGILSGCNLPVAPASTQNSLPTSTLQLPQNTPNLATETLTSTPTATTTTAGSNIVFAPGATAGVRMGTLAPGQIQEFTLSAAKNQPMIVIVDSPQRDVHMAVYEPDGTVLVDPSKGWINFQWILPTTGTYKIQVIGGSTTENYTLTVKVAEQIAVPAGGSPKTFSGSTVNGFVFSYAINCHAGKTMHLTLNVPAGSAYLDVFGIATGPVLDQSLQLTSWSGVMPSSQNYIVEIIPAAGQVVNYSLTISVN